MKPVPKPPNFLLFTLNRGGICDLPLKMRGHVHVRSGSPWVFLLVRMEGVRALALGESKWSLNFFATEDEAREFVRTVWADHDFTGDATAAVVAVEWKS